MRLSLGILALVATAAFTLQQPQAVFGDDPRDVMVKKAAEELVATPIQEAWKDLYQLVFREGGSRFIRRLGYLVSGVFGDAEALSLSRFVLDKIRMEVFDNDVNVKMWKLVSMEFYYGLRDWWAKTPENPLESADLGVWHALVALHKDVLGPALRGSSRVDKLNVILLDPDLKVIRKWVYDWKQGRNKSASAPAAKPTAAASAAAAPKEKSP